MVAWKKIHGTEDLLKLSEDFTEGQLLAFSIADAINYETLIILQANFKSDKLSALREKYSKPSKVAEFVYKKFKGDEVAMTAFIDSFNVGASNEG